MKKLFALILAICLSVTVLSALAEEGDVIGYYPDDHPESKVFMSTWVAEGGNWRIEMYGEDGSIKPYIVHRLGGNQEDIGEYATGLDKDNINQLTAEPVGLHYKQDTVSGNWDTTYYEDGNATFVLNENGKLIWNDLKEDAGKGLEFEKIGEFFGSRWTKGDIEVQFSDWYDGEYDIRCYRYGENNEILADAILKGAYDPATGTVTAQGSFDSDKPITVTFSFGKDGVIWTEDGVSTPMELSQREN